VFRLETPRLLLRSFVPADLEPFVAYRSDPLVAKYQGWDAPFPPAAGEKFIREMQDARPGIPGEWCQLAIQLKSSGEMIGDVAVFTKDITPLQAELGFTLARQHQGHGYAAEAVRTVIRHLFRDLNVHRVVAVCDVENHASYRLMERIGMRREAHLVDNEWYKGRWSSEYLYALLAHEWKDGET
jgi:RimJ/RimL family protein N-acetyltransferase